MSSMNFLENKFSFNKLTNVNVEVLLWSFPTLLLYK